MLTIRKLRRTSWQLGNLVQDGEQCVIFKSDNTAHDKRLKKIKEYIEDTSDGDGGAESFRGHEGSVISTGYKSSTARSEWSLGYKSLSTGSGWSFRCKPSSARSGYFSEAYI